MGVVYRAHDTRLDRTVAVKVVSERTDTDPAGHARLLREARAASALNHPGICTVHQVEEFEGQTVLVMEFVEGRPLSEVIPRTGLRLETVVRYGTQIADALAHAHARGVVHRDLNSQNVMVTAEDRIKILDFGLAKRAAAAVSDVTQSATTADAGVVAGALRLHVARGAARRARRPPPATSGALGIVLYEMVSGARPFSGQTGYALTAAIVARGAPGAPSTFERGNQWRHREMSGAKQGQSVPAGERRPRGARNGPDAIGNHGTSRRVAPGSRKALIGLAAGVVEGIAAAVAAWLLLGGARGTSTVIDSVAVLPFVNESRDADAEHLSDGLSEHLLNSLSQLSRPAG